MRHFSRLLAFVLVLAGSVGLEAAEKPNVVFILADDLGIGDVECFGGEKCQIPTPNFDRIAREGVKFTDAHPDVSHCVPTRMALMTGRHPWRYAAPKENGPWGYLTPRFSTDTFTLGNLMKNAGYRTGYIGKWHLGTIMPTTDGKVQGPENVDFTKPLVVSPNDYGFDQTFILPGSLDMFPYVFIKNGVFQGSVTAQKGWSAFNRIGPAAEDFVDTKVIGTFTTEAEKFITAPQDESQPFFLFLALTSPHTPVSPSRNFEGQSGLGLYGDFVYETDHCVGRVLDALEAAGLSENTMVIATSDHGAAAYAGNIRKATPFQFRELEQLGHYSGGGYRGFKFSIYEGGLRIPFVARWPKVIPAGRECDELIGLVDLMATLSQITGEEIPDGAGPDSISFLPLLDNPQAEGNREEMILQSTHGFAVRQENWKLTLCPGSGSAGRFGNRPRTQDAWKSAVESAGRVTDPRELLKAPYVQLFNLSDDPSESKNLAAEHPEKVREMFAIFETAIKRGRVTPGPNLENDRRVNPWQSVPRFVFKK
ncbi:MAG: arylsulfatase [Planctomycetaceae bacterium]|nr:arylsulfatase [Planctomycetaceae bacterium]